MPSPFQNDPVSRYSPICCNSRYVGSMLVASQGVQRRPHTNSKRIISDKKLRTTTRPRAKAGNGWIAVILILILILSSMAIGGKALEVYDAAPEMWAYAAGLLAFGWVTLSVAVHTRKQYSEGDQP